MADLPAWSQPTGNPQNVNPLSGLITVLQQLVKGQQQLITSIATLNTTVGTKFPDWVAVPATAASTGTAGQVAYDATHFYVCVATNTWVRALLATF